MSVKQVIVVRKDLHMRMGKACAQAAHASMKVVLDENMISDPSAAEREWLEGLFTKIVVYVNSEEELLAIYNKALENNIVASLIQDAGLTEFKEPTYTAVAVGPDYSENVDKITGGLPLL